VPAGLRGAAGSGPVPLAKDKRSGGECLVYEIVTVPKNCCDGADDCLLLRSRLLGCGNSLAFGQGGRLCWVAEDLALASM